MNPRTTIALALALALAALAYFLWPSEEAALPPEDPLLQDEGAAVLRAEEVSSIALLGPEKDSGRRSRFWRFSRDGAGWKLEVGDEDRMRPAQREPVEGLLSYLIALRALETHAPALDASSARRFGLAPDQAARLVLERQDGRPPFTIDLGAPLEARQLLVKISSRPEVLIVDTQLGEELPPTPAAWERRQIFELEGLAVDRIAISGQGKVSGERRIEVQREGGSWLLFGDLEGPAERDAVERLRNRLLALEHGREAPLLHDGPLPEDAAEGARRFEPVLRVALRAGDVEQELHLAAPRKEGIDARLPDGRLRVLPLGTWSELPGHALELRERRLFPGYLGPVRGVARGPLVNGGSLPGAARLRLERGRSRLRVVPPDGRERLLMDALEEREVLSRLREVRVLRWAPEGRPLADRAQAFLVVERETGRSTTLRMGAPEEDGSREVEVAETGLRGRLAPGALDFLDRPWWEYVEREAGGYGAWWKLAEVRVTGARGEVSLSPRLEGGAPRLDLLRPDGSRRLLPPEISRRIYDVLARIPVETFLGPVEEVEVGLDRPLLTVSWVLSPQSTERELKPPPADAPRGVLRIGAPLREKSFHAASSRHPGLVFEIAQQQVSVFDRLLDLAQR